MSVSNSLVLEGEGENSPVARDSPDSGSLGSVYVPEEVQIEYTEHAPRGQIRPGVSDEQSLASLSSLLDAQVGTLRHELMACMLEQRAGIMRAGEAAAEGERRHGMKRLALKQREVDDLQAQLSSARKRGLRLEEQVENTANRCGRLKKAVDDRMQLMHLWNIWKAYVARNKQLRNLVRIAVDKFQNTGVVKRVMREWHVLTLRAKMDALRREFETRLAHATEDYRREAEAREQQHQRLLGEVKEALAHERELRVRLEEDMRQAFMRGVCALNMEAINVFKQGVPHPLFNPNMPPVPPAAMERGVAGMHPEAEGPLPGMEEVARRIQNALDNASTRSFYQALQQSHPGLGTTAAPLPRPAADVAPHPQA